MVILHFLMFIDLPLQQWLRGGLHTHANTHISFMYQFKCTGGHVGPTGQSSPYSQTMAEKYPDMLTHPHSYG